MNDANKIKQIATAAADLAGAARGTGLSWDECIAVLVWRARFWQQKLSTRMVTTALALAKNALTKAIRKTWS